MNTEKWLNGKLIEGLFTFEEAIKISNETEGYRLPTIEEWEELMENSKFCNEDRIGHFTFENDTILRLPAAGYRYTSSGASNGQSSNGQSSNGYYWSSSVLSGNAPASYVYFNSVVLTTLTVSRAYSFSVYLIKE